MCGNAGVAGGNPTGNGQAGVVGGPGAEKDFEGGIVLGEEGFEMGVEIGLVAVERLEEADGRGEFGGSRAWAAVEEMPQSGECEAGEDSGCEQAEEADVEIDVRHRCEPG